ncbi:NADH:ubiquinone oxidoreductase 11 kDa subunit [Dunaliella salina]|uniref:NADH:ubiquinone oxidoreductase 11 kDa subunit n=1 Tax=Dunaliella salina TaxID=3046 RepID=A0ABQ7GK94_DUNSA|nr:NADH:ubiquinone oxidoreductase 11 kDa subunit [Dunaliella salina]|eukprot:KAF5835035.1 NADH:ubiquinone oxidoreductase 11 kDa subunit [Dunaliella salina]
MAWRSGLSKALQELRIHVDQTAPASKGVRDFLMSNYAEMKKANPYFPILVRESAGAEAKLIARYDQGVEKAMSVQGDTPAAITNKLEQLIRMKQ